MRIAYEKLAVLYSDTLLGRTRQAPSVSASQRGRAPNFYFNRAISTLHKVFYILVHEIPSLA